MNFSLFQPLFDASTTKKFHRYFPSSFISGNQETKVAFLRIQRSLPPGHEFCHVKAIRFPCIVCSEKAPIEYGVHAQRLFQMHKSATLTKR